MELVYIFFILGFVLLILGANWLVDGSVSLGLHTNLSPMVIGLTVVAFGTSLPELVINMFAAFKGSSDLALGNVLGSNIMNIFLILGIAALLMPLVVENISIRRDIPVGILATLMLAAMANDTIFGFENDIISNLDGIILIAAFALYLYVILKKGQPLAVDISIAQKKPYSIFKTLLLIVLGCAGLFFGGDWVSDGALQVAAALGISESAIGLTIVAAATSLPELVTAIVAALKKNIGIVMGNVLGSNIINIFMVLGVTAVIHPLEFNTKLNLDILLVLLANFVLLALIFLGKGLRLSKIEGVAFIGIYCIFIFISLHFN
jgi:cation:H+ antiporter